MEGREKKKTDVITDDDPYPGPVPFSQQTATTHPGTENRRRHCAKACLSIQGECCVRRSAEAEKGGMTKQLPNPLMRLNPATATDKIAIVHDKS